MKLISGFCRCGRSGEGRDRSIDLLCHRTRRSGAAPDDLGSVILNPLGIVNGANYLPITNPVAPGEFVLCSEAGSVLLLWPLRRCPIRPRSRTSVFSSTELPAGSVGWQRANQLHHTLRAQRSVRSVPGNPPGRVFEYRISFLRRRRSRSFYVRSEWRRQRSRRLHPDGSIVNANNPATVGEEIAVYATGLGAVTPASRTALAPPPLR